MSLIYTVTGTIGTLANYPTTPSGGVYGIDGGGWFGGGSIVGDDYSVTWAYSSDCNCIGAGGGDWPLPNPIIDVTLMINGHTYDFGTPLAGEFYLGSGLNIQQTDGYNDGGSFISTSVGFADTPHIGGEFEIMRGVDSSTQITAGYFILPTPAPIMGSGLPAVILACGLLGWWRGYRIGLPKSCSPRMPTSMNRISQPPNGAQGAPAGRHGFIPQTPNNSVIT